MRFRTCDPVSLRTMPDFRIHVPIPGKPAEGVVADELFCCFVHFWNGRSTPCPADGNCPACKEGNPARLTGYVWLCDDSGNSLSMLSLPYGACVKYALYCRQRGSIVGHKLIAERAGKSKRSRLSLKISGEQVLDAASIRTPPTIVSVLAKIWGVDIQSDKDYSARVPTV